MMRNDRIGLDLDRKNRFELLRRYFNAKNLGKVIVTETRHGFHLRIFVERDIPLEKTLELRRILGDDAERLGYDELKLQVGLEDWIDTLFEVKKDFDGIITFEREINPLLEASLTRIPAIKRRRR